MCISLLRALLYNSLEMTARMVLNVDSKLESEVVLQRTKDNYS